jgi:hypothetical protein
MAASKRKKLDSSEFAFPEERKEPLNDAKHVRNAIARFDQVEDVSDAERDAAWKRIRKAAKKYAVKVSDKSWRSLGRSDTKSKANSRRPSKVAKQR